VVACTPHPGFGTVSIRNGALVRHVDLGTCRTWSSRLKLPTLGPQALTIAVTRTGSHGTQTIVYRSRPVYTVHERYDRIPGGTPGPIELFGMSPDRRWVLFAIDPMSSASLAADGLTMRAVPIAGGRPRVVATGLLGGDYRAWCDGKLVMTAGNDRIAAHHKWLVVTAPPTWRTRILMRDSRRAFGSLACDRNGVVVQATPNSTTTMNPHWELWRVGLDGTHSVLDTPPPGFSDDSPRVSRNGTIVFVRSRNGRGTLWSPGVGALVAVGRDFGYYGHRSWFGVSWSLQR
jgi:hypothetical protein